LAGLVGEFIVGKRSAFTNVAAHMTSSIECLTNAQEPFKARHREFLSKRADVIPRQFHAD
jgi:hypothetical protein